MKTLQISSSTAQAEVITFGATLKSFIVTTLQDIKVDIVLGYDDAQRYKVNSAYFGCVLGRVANRIAKGQFTLDGRQYQLSVNNGPNALHGGAQNSFSMRDWSVVAHSENSVKLSLIGLDGEESYPGTLEVFVTYTLKENELHIEYSAQLLEGEATIVNLSNHSYFNLSGNFSQSIVQSHNFKFNARQYLPLDQYQIPTGAVSDSLGTPFDFTSFKTLQENGINTLESSTKGYDHCLLIKRGDQAQLEVAAEVWCKESGLMLTMCTSEPSFQFYSANYLDENEHQPAKEAHKVKGYRKHHAFCLEAQRFPNAINCPDWRSQTILRKGLQYKQHTVYRIEHVRDNGRT